MTLPTQLQGPRRTVLLTGGTSLTSIAITKLLLKNTTCNILLASRRGPLALTQPLLDELCSSVSSYSSPSSPCSPETLQLRIKQRVRCIPFDWFSPPTYSSAFSLVSTGTSSHSSLTASGPGLAIHVIYLVPLGSTTACDRMNEFIQYAAIRGVKRFVLLGSEACMEDKSALSKVYKYLDALSKGESRLEYAILYPSRFFRNSLHEAARYIPESNTLLPNNEDPKRGSSDWVDVNDLAEIAAEALLKEDYKVTPGTEYIAIGSELLTFPLVTSLLSRNLRKPIVFEHQHQSIISRSQAQTKSFDGRLEKSHYELSMSSMRHLSDDMSTLSSHGITRRIIVRWIWSWGIAVHLRKELRII
ncbi:hypothetical protein K435DRAFT_965411 [Dendrothele bispora CBS 962.96]|uniref:NAD(P)-binding protein n=1 Tax=Dendrothele bispora (strain CBS 962.96) TaxID=1314807 RepID=A0A4S8M635_DENBC|nr:hypothetical protein K435DRAFT_965411 [Dendrothele bispora CBS 962.96]